MPAIGSTLPGAADSDCLPTSVARRHPLQDGVDGGEQHGRVLAAFYAGEAAPASIMRCATMAACGDTRS